MPGQIYLLLILIDVILLCNQTELRKCTPVIPAPWEAEIGGWPKQKLWDPTWKIKQKGLEVWHKAEFETQYCQKKERKKERNFRDGV
jgi:hypothetical protein